MPETGFLLTAKTFSFQQLIEIFLLCYKELRCVCIVFVFHKQTTPRFTVRARQKCVIFRQFYIDSKEANMPGFQTFPNFAKYKKLLKFLMLFFKILHYRGSLGKI